MDDVLKMKYYFNQHHSRSSSAFSPNDCRVRAGRGGCAGGLEAALTGDDFSAPRTATVSCLWTAGRKHIWSQTADTPAPRSQPHPSLCTPRLFSSSQSSFCFSLLEVSPCFSGLSVDCIAYAPPVCSPSSSSCFCQQRCSENTFLEQWSG